MRFAQELRPAQHRGGAAELLCGDGEHLMTAWLFCKGAGVGKENGRQPVINSAAFIGRGQLVRTQLGTRSKELKPHYPHWVRGLNEPGFGTIGGYR